MQFFLLCQKSDQKILEILTSSLKLNRFKASQLKPQRLAELIKASLLLYVVFYRFESHPRRKASRKCSRSTTLWARGMGIESCSLRAFLREPPCRTCKKDQAGIQLQDYWSGSPDQNKQTTWFNPKNDIIEHTRKFEIPIVLFVFVLTWASRSVIL